MMAYQCDHCGTMMSARDERRYIVRMEVQAIEPLAELTEADLERDHLRDMAAYLEELEELPEELTASVRSRAMEYDLCPTCAEKFIADPFGKNTERTTTFSSN
jgi:hypothetical protein